MCTEFSFNTSTSETRFSETRPFRKFQGFRCYTDLSWFLFVTNTSLSHTKVSSRSCLQSFPFEVETLPQNLDFPENFLYVRRFYEVEAVRSLSNAHADLR